MGPSQPMTGHFHRSIRSSAESQLTFKPTSAEYEWTIHSHGGGKWRFATSQGSAFSADGTILVVRRGAPRPILLKPFCDRSHFAQGAFRSLSTLERLKRSNIAVFERDSDPKSHVSYLIRIHFRASRAGPSRATNFHPMVQPRSGVEAGSQENILFLRLHCSAVIQRISSNSVTAAGDVKTIHPSCQEGPPSPAQTIAERHRLSRDPAGRQD